jgi:hypothetical protein
MARRTILVATPLLILLGVYVSCTRERDTVYPPNPPVDYTRDAAIQDSTGGDASVGDSAGGNTDAGASVPPPLPLDPFTETRLATRLDERARSAAAGKKDGPVFSGVLRQGGQLTHSITLAPTRCYSVFAAGDAPGIGELDIEIHAQVSLPLPQPGPLLTVDNTTGPEARISPCWKSLVPVVVPALVTVRATRGQGPVVAQIYSK